jgi:hypothetical protein
MLIELQRTFGHYTEPQAGDDEVDWHRYFSSNPRRLRWDDLHQKRISMILGEAGIGKTAELQLQAQRLSASGRFAFFVPLNALKAKDHWQMALGSALSDFSAWQRSGEEAYFFFDAVDEARLQSHADFAQALWVVREALLPNLSTVRIVLSSRITDWTVPEVREAVTNHLLRPMTHAIVQSSQQSLGPGRAGVGAPAPIERIEELIVVTLDALSGAEARQCARHFGLEDEAGFWTAVDEGDYDFMASRPLDLRWMVELWNQRRVFGNYAELIEANVSARLSDVNPSYEQAGKVLSDARLREGASELAAAMEFGGYSFITVSRNGVTQAPVLNPFVVLRTWKPTDVQLLLATAIFDEASFDRVKFHHRSVREYLAARWVRDKVVLGVPFIRLKELFVSKAGGVLTLVPARRSVLAWLAAVDVNARSWVVSNFPEILLHEGDPESWDRASADRAVSSIIANSDTRPLSLQRHNSRSEYMRVSRALSPGLVSAIISKPNASAHSRSISYRLAIYGKLADCAAPAFEIYQDTYRLEWERASALAILENVGTGRQREQVLADIESGKVRTNELLASALPCVDWTSLGASGLAGIFRAVGTEGDFGNGPVGNAIRRDMLPKTDASSAMLLLRAVFEASPKPEPGQPFARFPRDDQPAGSWLLHVFPYCLERVLELTEEVGESSLPFLIDAVEQLETLRQGGFADSDEVERVRTAVRRLPRLRWNLALAIAEADKSSTPANKLVWANSCVVSFDEEDLPELTRRVHEADIAPGEQDIWFNIGVEVAIKFRRGRARKLALKALCGELSGPRFAAVLERYQQWIAGARSRRSWDSDKRARRLVEKNRLAEVIAEFIENREAIADGSDPKGLQRLFNLAYGRSAYDDKGLIKLDVVETSLGLEAAELLSCGLQSFWKEIQPPNPSDFPNGQIAGPGLAALAGVTLSAQDTLAFSRLSADEVTVATQVAVWALPGPPEWLETLHTAWPQVVEAALNPWVLREVTEPKPGTGIRGAFVMAMRCPSPIRRGLISGATSLVLSGSVKNIDTVKQLVPALHEDGLMTDTEFDYVCQSHLQLALSVDVQFENLSWLQIWAGARPEAAWAWFKQELCRTPDDVESYVSTFATTMGGLEWLRQPWNDSAIGLLLEVAAVLKEHGFHATNSNDPDEAWFGPRTKQMFYAIARGLVRVRGVAGRKALQELIAEEAQLERRLDLLGLLQEHAELEASATQHWDIERLRRLHSAFDCDPQNEAQLYDQVVARLEEIRTSLEEGPFSERKLFPPGTPEKHLQLWLASKFRDTQNRRFNVHREEEVDNDKKTDIQLSCRFGNVCVEIKPADADRSYSANSLVDTLETQVVGQYLKGNNSTRGILVLVQLDSKGYDIPGGAKKQAFEALVEYLETQAQRIKESSPHVNELMVFPMSCVI